MLDLRRVDVRGGYLGAALMLLCAAGVRLLSGAPYRIYFMLNAHRTLPPMLTLGMGNALMTLCAGFACGLVLSCPRRGCRCSRYRGGMLFILMALFWFLTYPLLFRGCLVLLALLSLLLAWLFCLLCVPSFFHVHPICGWILVLLEIWILYLILSLLWCLLLL